MGILPYHHPDDKQGLSTWLAFEGMHGMNSSQIERVLSAKMTRAKIPDARAEVSSTASMAGSMLLLLQTVDIERGGRPNHRALVDELLSQMTAE